MKRSFSIKTCSVLSLLIVAAGYLPSVVFAAVCDFDGDNGSDLVIVQANGDGNLDWLAVSPRTGKTRSVIKNFGDASSKLIPGNWLEANEAVPAILEPVGPGPRGQATWRVAYLEHGELEQYSKKLGRHGDVVILGGDYDGNGVTDALLLKQTTGKLGLRVNFFLAGYNANNLGKERLYRRLGAPFRDVNFFYSPNGKSDFLGVLRRGTSGQVLLLRPFTDTPTKRFLGTLPSEVKGPLPLKQQAGQPDLFLFYKSKGTGTEFLLKDSSGKTLSISNLPVRGTVMVGDYLSDGGWEVSIGTKGKTAILNPVTGTQSVVDVPPGAYVSCVQTVKID